MCNLAGACGFGEYGRKVNDANVAGVSKLYKNGTGCGACYQVQNLNIPNLFKAKYIKITSPIDLYNNIVAVIIKLLY